MATVPTRFASLAAPTTSTPVYTVPVDTVVVYTKVILSNTTAAAARATVRVAGVDVISSVQVAANATIILEPGIVTKPGEITLVSGTVASAINITICGVITDIYA